MRLQARKLLAFPTEVLWDKIVGEFTLVFDNRDEIRTNAKEVIYSSYFWDFHRKFPKTPLLPKHHVASVLKGEPLTSTTHIELLGNVYWETLDTYAAIKETIRDDLTKMIFEVTNAIYNDLIHKVEKYVMSIDILDFIEVSTHPRVVQAFDSITGTTDSIDGVYSEIMNVIKNDESLKDNSLVLAVKSKMVNKNQVMQCVGPRGFVSEVDGAIMPIPVRRSYTQGMRSLYNCIAESRTAAKSLYFSEAPLQDSEYFARRLQFIAMDVSTLVRADCGSTNYMQWKIRPKAHRDGKEIYAGDLPFMVGKYYLDEATNTLKIIGPNDHHLVDTVVKLRHVMGCQLPDTHSVCEVCFGQESDNISPTANLGHVCAATMTHQTSQSVLSTKHLDASSVSDPIAYTEKIRKYFIPTDKNNLYHLDPIYKNKNTRMIISKEEMFGLTDIFLINNIRDISPARIGNIGDVGFATKTTSDNTPFQVKLEQNGRKVLPTIELLEYLKQKRWTLNESSAFVFDMADWDYDKPLFKLPDMEYSYSKHSKAVSDIIESKMSNLADRIKPESPTLTLFELFDLVNSKIKVNLSLLEVIIYSMMCRDIHEKDYRLGRGNVSNTLGVSKDIMSNRSLSVAYAYQGQADIIKNPKSFFPEGRSDSIFDVFICPAEVLDSRK